MINQIIFLVRLIYIIFSEAIIFLILNNKNNSIVRLTNRLSNINMLYVKIFQAIALNTSFIDEAIDMKLIDFTDHAPFTIEDIDFKSLYDLSVEHNLDFGDGYNKPINSGMISLVFKAHDVNGKKLAVKIKRLNIDKTLEDAISNLLFVINLFFKGTQVYEIVYKNINTIRNQTDFTSEIENMIHFSENCKHLDYIVVPSVIESITRKHENVIVMDYIESVKLSELTSDEKLLYAEKVIKLGFVTLFVHGFIHCDLHPGNILFIKNEKENETKLGILDFGIVSTINPEFKEIIYNLVVGLDVTNVSFDKLAEKCLLSGIIEPVDIIRNIPKKQFIIIKDILSETLSAISNDTNQIHVYKFIDELNKLTKTEDFKHLRMKPSNDFVKLQLIIAMSHGITKKLCGDNCILLVDKVLRELFRVDLIFDD
jgi:predicted unusual protein kinase regulating ubiquinone biosynthesis (AarF/ABC1/UbiB family)